MLKYAYGWRLEVACEGAGFIELSCSTEDERNKGGFFDFGSGEGAQAVPRWGYVRDLACKFSCAFCGGV